MNKKPELLAPAGSLEKLKYAIYYGADAVYAGVPDFSMRYRINKFDEKTLKEGIEYAHKFGKKFYVTINIYPRNKHLAEIEKHLKFLKKISARGGFAFGGKPDRIIISDPGVIKLAKKYLPKIPIHLSTQANAGNWQAVKFWQDLGVKRVVLAREVTMEEIKEIRKKVPGVELEYFVHGAMCMSYSGRCILSKWMADRSANLGDCAQPCRWRYRATNNQQQTTNNQQPKTLLMSVEDEKGEFEIDLEEDANGTYFFNSKDLNLLNHLDDLRKAGVDSFKIEGRNKSVFYLAVVTRAYRRVIDSLEYKMSTSFSYRNKLLTRIIKEEQRELDSLTHRGYTTGFLFGHPEHNFEKSHENSPYQFVGEVMESSLHSPPPRILSLEGRGGYCEDYMIKIKPHNAIYKKDKIEIIAPEKNIPVKIKNILDEDKNPVASAHGGQDKSYYLEIDKKDIKPLSLIRKKV